MTDVPHSCESALRTIDLTVGGTVGAHEVGLPEEAVADLRSHVATCPACAETCEQIRADAEALGLALAADAAAEAAADRALAAAVESRLPRGRVRRFPAWAARAAVLLLSLGVGFAYMRWTAPSDVDVAARDYRLRPPHAEGYAGPRFVDVTEQAGIRKLDHTGTAGRKDWMVETVGHGAAAFDMDADGDLDLFVPDGNRLDPAERVTGTWRLYRNDGAMRFADVTEGSGLDVDSWGSGAVAADVDADGLPDLFVPCFGKNHLFRNLGGGRFEDVTERAGVAGLESEWSTAAAMGDLDGDGDLDLYVANYADMRRYMVEAPRGRNCTWRSMPVACGPSPLEPQRDRMYFNRGDGTFEDVTTERTSPNKRYSFQPIVLDLDRDGALDVFVACDAQANLLLRNDGAGRFVETARVSGTATDGAGQEQACMGVATGDVDDDGRPDLFVTNFSHESNCLYRNVGAPRMLFGDVTAAAGLEQPSRMTLGWGASFVDFDNDGDQDLMYANGHLYPDVERNAPETTYAQHVAVFENDGIGRFREVSSDAGAVLHPRVHRGLVAADFDDDGATDLFLTVLNDRAVLLRNDGRGVGRAARFVLRRRDGRTEAAGAHLVAELEGVPGRERVSRDLLVGSSFGGTEDPRLAVGLGASGRIRSASVTWPGGSGQVVEPAEGEAGFGPGLYEVVEGRARARRLR